MEWRPINGYEGRYEVNENGEIRSLVTSKVLKPTVETYGYLRVGLRKDGKTKRLRVHRIVAEAFVENPNPDTFKYVNHKDGNKSNNNANNLEWCDSSYNVKYNAGVLNKHRKSPMRFPVVQLDDNMNFIAEYNSINEATRATGVHHQSISWVVNKQHYYKTAGGYIWMKKSDYEDIIDKNRG